MRKGFMLVICVIVLMSMAAGVPNTDAHQRYSSCGDCHGLFTSKTSPKGTVFPNDDKHYMHRGSQYMNIDCDLCHSYGDDNNPFIGFSDGTANNPGLGCSGCHEGPGLRAYHTMKRISCSGCHRDGPPEPENILPTYYGTVDTNVDNPCNPESQSNVNENWSIGDFIGLDNDGDNDVDGNDSDCGPSNKPPTVVDDDYITQEDKQLTVPDPGVLGNDSDPDGDSITALLVDDVKNGTLVFYDNGSFTYNPNLDFSGTDSFTYRADDGQSTSNIATVTITVNPVNDPPLADANGPYSGTVGSPVNFDGSDSSDPDGTIISYSWEFGDGNTGEGVSPTHSYVTPGTFEVSLTVTDNAGSTDTATTTAEIAEHNQPPFAVDDDYTTNEDTQLNVPGPGVLGNDSDPDGDVISVILVSNTSNGNLSLNGDGSFTYDPDLNFDGKDQFTYVASDGQLESNTIATVTITVNPVNDAPQAMDDAYTIDNTSALISESVLDNDNDPDGDPLTAILVDDVINGSLTLNEDGTFSYNPHPDYFGEDSFTYFATDGQLDSDVATATITVNPPGIVDLDIAGFRVTKRVSLRRAKSIGIRLAVRNNGSIDGNEKRSVTIVGTQNGNEVFRTVRQLTANRRSTLQLESFTPDSVGEIIWIVTIDDDDNDVDQAKAFTKVVD